ncbi:MAG: hypothetical protein QM697_06010 [Lachnospiraceae bacterium]
MIFEIIGLVIGVMILGAGIYYLVKEKNDQESRKIYSITSAVGAAIILGLILKIVIGVGSI